MGAPVGWALKAAGFDGEVLGWDASAGELAAADERGAIDVMVASREAVLEWDADVVGVATPVVPFLEWRQTLAPMLGEGQLVTDVGSTKKEISAQAAKFSSQPGLARFLP